MPLLLSAIYTHRSCRQCFITNEDDDRIILSSCLVGEVERSCDFVWSVCRRSPCSLRRSPRPPSPICCIVKWSITTLATHTPFHEWHRRAENSRNARKKWLLLLLLIVTTYYRLHPDQLSTVSTTARLRAGRQFNCSLRRHVIVQASVISRRSLLSTNKGNRSNRADAPTFGRRENIIYTPHNNTRPPNPK